MGETNDHDDEKYYRKLYITIISAQNLQNVRPQSKSRVHARVTIGGKKRTEKRTPTDNQNGLNPAWNHRVRFNIREPDVKGHGFPLVIKLYCSRRLQSDRYIGEVHTSVKELFDQGPSAVLSVPITMGSAETSSDGILKFSYSFGEKTWDTKRAFLKEMLKAGVEILVSAVVCYAKQQSAPYRPSD